ncbi:MAG: lipocalin-like domain-containing protein, partial [Vicinamibacteraceae bacterium]
VLAALVSLPAAGPWKQAAAGYTYAFPRDHASHPDFKIEWWYYTGNVDAADGRRFGYQVTFFRIGVDRTPTNPSKWAVRDLFVTHLAVSDISGGRYLFDERLSRGGPGLAGAETDRYRVWNDDWTAGLDDRGRHVIEAHGARIGLTLTLDEGKRPTINGVGGISQKGAQAGNASHYYSLTRMPTRGTVSINGMTVPVTGTSWMDHEFGTSFLEAGQQGWDWLSMQLDDGRELMLYQLRKADGSRDPHSSGTLVGRDGQTRHLSADDFSLTPAGRTFTSRSGAIYPVAWRIAIPSAGVTLDVTTPLVDQELTTDTSSAITYWEGAIDVAGRAKGASVRGRGYLEMTGYRGSLGRVLSSS